MKTLFQYKFFGFIFFKYYNSEILKALEFTAACVAVATLRLASRLIFVEKNLNEKQKKERYKSKWLMCLIFSFCWCFGVLALFLNIQDEMKINTLFIENKMNERKEDQIEDVFGFIWKKFFLKF